MTKVKRHRVKVTNTQPEPAKIEPEKQEPQTMHNDRFAIYSLRFPDTRNVFYIGQAKDPYKRFIQHLQPDGTNKEKDAIINDLKGRGFAPLMQVETWCSGKTATDMTEASFIEYYRAWRHPLVNITLHLCSDVEVARQVAEHEREIATRYASLSPFQHFLMMIRPLFIFNIHARQEYRWRMEEEQSILSTLKEMGA